MPLWLMPLIRGCSAGSKGKLEITNDSMAPSRGGTHATLFLDSPAPSETLGAAQIDLGVRAAPATVLPVPLPLSDEADPWPRGPAVAADLLDAVRTVRATRQPPPGHDHNLGVCRAQGGHRATACGVAQAKVATEIGFGIHESHRNGGARVALPVAGRAAGIVVDSRPWGN